MVRMDMIHMGVIRTCMLSLYSYSVHIAGDSRAWEAVQRQVARQLRERKESARAALDNATISALSKVTTSATSSTLPAGQMKKFSSNCFSLMTVTGAKGSAVRP